MNLHRSTTLTPGEFLECGDLSPLSEGDLSPSDTGARPHAGGQVPRRKSGDRSPHSIARVALPPCFECRRRRAGWFLLAAGLLFAAAFPAVAATKTWTGLGSDNNWSTPQNWSPSGAPQDGDALVFPGNTPRNGPVNNLTNLRVQSILFSGNVGGYSISGNLIRLESNITDTHTGIRNRVRCYVEFVNGGGFFTTGGTGELEVNGDVIISGGRELALFCGPGTLTVSGAILGVGSVIKHGTNALVFAGNFQNAFDGPLTVREGTLYLGKPAGVTAAPCPLILGHLDDFTFGHVVLQNPHQIADTITNLINHGSIDLNGWDEALGPIHFYDGNIRTGTGTLELLAPVWQRSWIYVRPCSISGTIYSPGDATFQLDDDDGFQVWANITGAGGLVQNGEGQLTVRGTNTFPGPVTVNGGSLTVGTYLSLGSGSQVTLNGFSGLELYAFSGSAGSLGAINKQLTIMRDYSWFNVSGGDWIWGGNIRLNFEGTMSCNAQSSTLRIFGGIQGTGGIWFGGNQIELLGNNTYTGPTVTACTLLTINNGNGRPFSDSLVVGGDYRVRSFNYILPEAYYTNATAELRFNSSPFTTHPAVTVLKNGLVNLNGRNKQINQLNFHGGRVATGAGNLYAYTITSYPEGVTAIIDGSVVPAFGDVNFNVADGPVLPDMTVNANIAGLAGSSITKQGAGELRFPNGNSYGGLTTVIGGLLQAGNVGSLGSTGTGTVVSNGATLQIEYIGNVAEPLMLTGLGRGGTLGALVLLPGTGVSAPITLNGGAGVRVDSSFSILSGVINGTGSFTKLGAGLLQFGGGSGAANTFTGDTIVNEGELVLFKPPFVQAVPGNLVVGSGALAGPTTIVRHFNPDQIWANITVNRGGLLNLNGFDEDSGDVTLNGGGDIQTGAGILYLGGDGVNLSVTPGNSGQSTISGRLGLFPGAHRFSVGSRSSALGGAELDIPADIIESGPSAAITKEGGGQLLFRGNNSYGGLLSINAGTITASNNYALGTLTGGTVVNNNASLQLDGGRAMVNEALTLNSSNALAFTARNGSNYWAGPITLNRDSAVHVELANAILHVPTTVSGPGGLVKLGPGALQFFGTPSNNYAGLTTVLEGELRAARTQGRVLPDDVLISGPTASLRTGHPTTAYPAALVASANVTVRNGGLWTLTRGSETIRALNGDGRVDILSGSTLTVSNDVACDFSGPMTGTGSFIKQGPFSQKRAMTAWGDWTLSGINAIGGGDFFFHGTLRNTALSVAGGNLRGDGRIFNTVIVGSGSLIGPASEFPDRQGGDLQMDALTLNGGSIAELGFFGPQPTGGNDRLIVDGPVTMTFPALLGGFFYPPREGDVLTLVQKTTPGAITGAFRDWPEGVVRKWGDVTVRATYLGGDGNDFTLTVTNTALANGGYRLAEGNGNQSVEPNECNLLYLSLVNRRATPLTLATVSLRSLTPGVVVTIPSASYPTIPGGATRENLTPFQFRTEPTVACGSPVELELIVSTPGEGLFAVALSPTSGLDCGRPTGGCESCTVVSGEFTTNAPTLFRFLNFVGAPSVCFPPKLCPETNFNDSVFIRFLTHRFTNNTPNELCLTARLRFGCPGVPTNALGAAAYLGVNAANDPCFNYLGDSGADGTQPFSFRVPANTNFFILLSARNTSVVCPRYTLELFGLPCPSPTLYIAKDAPSGYVRLHWSTAYPEWRLQSAGSLNGPLPSFQNVAVPPAISGGRYNVTNQSVGAQRLYHLAH